MNSRLARAAVAACFVIATWLSAAPAPATALEPPRPLPGYHPAFVTETDEHPMRDCLWASGAMLLDKWTNGKLTPTHQRLRTLARDHKGGSDLRDLHVAFARLGFDLRFSPDGGDRITMGVLLQRLAKGAGAVILGDDSKFPYHYGRWDYGFWKLKKGEDPKKDNHAVYVERYDRRRGRVWLMDPLGHPGWKGEWISVRALRRFAWKSRGGVLYAATTPTAKPAPFAGVRIQDPEFSMTATTLDATWGLRAPRRWTFPGTDLRVAFDPADDALLAAAQSVPVTAVSAAAPVDAPAHPTLNASSRSLEVTAALPTTPGVYTASITLKERRFGHVVVQASDVAVFVPGHRRATLRMHVRDDSAQAGKGVSVSLSVANTGEISWAEPVHNPGAPVLAFPARNTRLVARWIRMGDLPGGDDVGGTTLPGSSPAADVGPVDLQAVPLMPGRKVTVRATVPAPDTTGVWALVIDLTDDVDGSFAAGGSQPVFQVFDVVAPRGMDPAE